MSPATRREGGARRPRLAAFVAAGTLVSAVIAGLAGSAGSFGSTAGAPLRAGSEGCLTCHDGIEDMHPAAKLSCVDCHGGDAEARKKLDAHVQPQRPPAKDESVEDLDSDPAYRRFVNPMDLRIVDTTCGDCHAEAVRWLRTSLHGTTAGHLSDGFYEMGLLDEKGSVYGVFGVPGHQAEPGGEVDKLTQIPAFKDRARDQLSTHYTDLPRKECMQCHLWSEGRAVRGRVGFDGDYRGQGCAACHVEYAVSGMSDSADRAAIRNEPGHAARHTMTAKPTTEMCTTCHYGDASIGLNFRGLSQLPPGAPGGPEIPGTTDSLLNRQFYLNDNQIAPPDLHHASGMHCIDCHTLSDVMGDGKLHGQMEHAVEISCEACHGTFDEISNMKTERGSPLEHLFEDEGNIFMRSKVSGDVHQITQVKHVIDPARPEYNREGERAMTGQHGKVECYTCHSGWNPNFLGFHFYRNEQLSQLDVISGGRTPGRVTTQEKVFATWKSFYAGLNEDGRIAPYLTGFSTMGTVDDRDGKRILDQAMPVTAEGLSGMTMIHHQLHTVRPTARSCVECHRSSATWGMGSPNFRLSRQLAFVADRRGVEIIALNRAQLASSTALAKIILPDVVEIEIDADPLQGHAEYLYVAEGGRGIHVVDVRDPSSPTRVAFVESVGPRGLELVGDYLYCADGIGGLRVYDVSTPAAIERIAVVPMFDAYEVTVQWPYAYVADGPGGLVIVDIRAPISPRVVSGLALSKDAGNEPKSIDVATLFQYSRPLVDADGEPLPWRTEARNLCAVVDEFDGLFLIDVTEPTHPQVVYPKAPPPGVSMSRGGGNNRGRFQFRGIEMLSHVDIGTPQGGERTSEHDYVYMLEERLQGNNNRLSYIRILDVSDPENVQPAGRVEAGAATEMIVPAAFFNAPFLQKVMFTPGQDGVFATDVSVSAEPNQLGAFVGIRSAYVVAVEEFPLDKMLDEDGKRLKDVSHEGSRWMYKSEIEHLLDVPGQILGTIGVGVQPLDAPGSSARSMYARLDKDRSGLLNEEEYERAGGEAVDDNRDGRITLYELAAYGGAFDTGMSAVPVDEAQVFLETRVDEDGDISRLLDGLNPFDFDEDDNSRLDRKELESAFFTALDLDRDKRLSLAELSRHPGSHRQLRYGDLGSLKRWSRTDLNRGGTISRREFKLEDRDWEACDVDRDDGVQLPIRATAFQRENGILPLGSEWPTRRRIFTGLPPTASLETVLAVFDKDKSGTLSRREMRKRPALFLEFDRDRNDVVDEAEINRRIDILGQLGVDVCATDFVRRWDLDGSGKVEEEELPEGAWIPIERKRKKGRR
jgi:hypothetical protein